MTCISPAPQNPSPQPSPPSHACMRPACAASSCRWSTPSRRRTDASIRPARYTSSVGGRCRRSEEQEQRRTVGVSRLLAGQPCAHRRGVATATATNLAASLSLVCRVMVHGREVLAANPD
uniref:Uncharacterized protein n=1 Tax=Arundo donax TaxID=35708 RepID=A0A0A9B2D0_ARUDO